MKECRCCKRPIDEIVEFCPFCGYDPKTDAVSASFRQNAVSSEVAARKMRADRRSVIEGISPGVKRFAFIGLTVIVFSIFYKHNFNLNGVIAEVKQPGDKTGIKVGNLIPLKVEKKKESGGKVEEYEIFNPATPLILQGVTWGGVMPQAVINSTVYHVGDVIQGAKIIKISKQGVVVLYNGLSYLLPSFVSKYKPDKPSK